MLHDPTRYPKSDAEEITDSFSKLAAGGAEIVEEETIGISSTKFALGTPQDYQRSQNHEFSLSRSSSQNCADFIQRLAQQRPSDQRLAQQRPSGSEKSMCGDMGSVACSSAPSVVGDALPADIKMSSSQECADHSPASVKQAVSPQALRFLSGDHQQQQPTAGECTEARLFRNASAHVLGTRSRNQMTSLAQSLRATSPELKAKLKPRPNTSPARITAHAAASASCSSVAQQLSAQTSGDATVPRSPQAYMKHGQACVQPGWTLQAR